MVQWTNLGPFGAPLALAFFLAPAHAQLKDFGNRLEGTAFRPHAARGYELLGFYAYRAGFPLRDDVTLRLLFFLPANQPVYIEARELTAYKQYRMRPKDESVSKTPGKWSEFSNWPVSSVLKPNAIGADNLGVIIRLNSDAEYAEDLAPAILLDTQQKAPPPIREYVLYLTADRSLKSLDYEIQGVNSYRQSYKYRPSEKSATIAGRTVIPIRFPGSEIPTGPVLIRITGRYANDVGARQLEIPYRFYHQPI